MHIYEFTYSIMGWLIVCIYGEKTGDRTLPSDMPFICSLHMILYIFSSAYNVMFDNRFWVDNKVCYHWLCCRVCVSEVYDSLCCQHPIDQQKLFYIFLVAILNMRVDVKVNQLASA